MISSNRVTGVCSDIIWTGNNIYPHSDPLLVNQMKVGGDQNTPMLDCHVLVGDHGLSIFGMRPTLVGYTLNGINWLSV